MSRPLQDAPASTRELSEEAPKSTEPFSRSPPSCSIRPEPKVTSAPLKSLRKITLITPPIASEP